MIFAPSPDAYRLAAEALTRGDLIGLPTETVYGLAANALDEVAVAKIFAAKGRPATNPLIVHVATLQQARLFFAADLTPRMLVQLDRASAFWPGPLTIVAPKSSAIPAIVTAGGDTVAIRVPAHPVAFQLLSLCPFPVAAPSANRSNYVSPTTAQHVWDDLGESIAMVLDGGPCTVGLESTILRLGDENRPPQIMRLGCITAEQLTCALGEPVTIFNEISSLETIQIAPGQFAKHYSPHTPCTVVAPETSSPVDPSQRRVLRIRMLASSQSLAGYADVWTLSSDSTLETAAANLYQTLRRADQSQFDAIEIDRCDHSGMGKALADRINRATSVA